MTHTHQQVHKTTQALTILPLLISHHKSAGFAWSKLLGRPGHTWFLSREGEHQWRRTGLQGGRTSELIAGNAMDHSILNSSTRVWNDFDCNDPQRIPSSENHQRTQHSAPRKINQIHLQHSYQYSRAHCRTQRKVNQQCKSPHQSVKAKSKLPNKVYQQTCQSSWTPVNTRTSSNDPPTLPPWIWVQSSQSTTTAWQTRMWTNWWRNNRENQMTEFLADLFSTNFKI